MVEEEKLQKSIERERVLVFLSIIIVVVLLTGSWQSLLAVFSGSFNAVTGASTAVDAVSVKDYILGLWVFTAMIALAFYAVYALRHPKPQLWKVELPKQKEPLVKIDHETSLDRKLDRINEEIIELRTAKEPTKPAKAPKKLVHFSNVKEDVLRSELGKVNARLQGYKKTRILEHPSGKTAWDNNLEEIKQQLIRLKTAKFKKAKIRELVPSKESIALAREREKLQKEWERVMKKKKQRSTIILEEPSKKGKLNLDLEQVKNKIAGLEKMKVKSVIMRDTAPSVHEISMALEKKKLISELEKVDSALRKGRKNPSYLIRRFIPSMHERELQEMKKKLEKKGFLPKKELARIEQKLMELRQKR
ncbi:MAG: hypothetical protein AABX05_04460 [Nanoarchaeota archaeon]